MARAKILQDIDRELDLVERESAKLRKKQAELDEEEKEIGLETLDHWTKPQEGLSEDPWTNPEEIWYTDGSSFALEGKRRARYAVISNFETIEYFCHEVLQPN